MRVTITIDTDNAAFADDNIGAETARILRDLADKVEGTNFVSTYDRRLKLRDINGNTVGLMEAIDPEVF